MTALLTPQTFEFFATYLLAGYIVIIVRSKFIVGLQPKPAELVIEAIILSLINQLAAAAIHEIASWVGLIVWVDDRLEVSAVDTQLVFLAKILILPTFIGLLLGYNLTAGWKNAFLRRLSLPVIHPVQRAHDYAFGNDRHSGFVMITYDDGTLIAGFFGEKSLAATDANRSDLYLESLYKIDEDGNWEEPTPQRSGWINLVNVRTVEFLDSKETIDE